MKAWSPNLYLKFNKQRMRPACDLLEHVPITAASQIVDLGCGPGNSTELLRKRFPEASITGIDSSTEMLLEARKRLPSATFIESDASTWEPAEKTDLVFANALFQWIPNHLEVLKRLLKGLCSEAVLAIQVPDNLQEPSHALMNEISAKPQWAKKFAKPIKRESIHSISTYYNELITLATQVDIWRTEYYHPLPNIETLIEMLSSTGLRPFLGRLNDQEQRDWLAEYKEHLITAYPALSDGNILFCFPRLFIVAVTT